MKGEKRDDIIPRSFLDIGFGDNDDEPTRQSSDAEEQESKSWMDLKSRVKKNFTNGNKVDRDHEITAQKEFTGWLSNQVNQLSALKDVDDQASESMIKKARVSVRTRSESIMVSININYLHGKLSHWSRNLSSLFYFVLK